MARVTVRVLGCGDAFASGGRLQTCFFLDAEPDRLLIDCGATAMVGCAGSVSIPAWSMPSS